MTQRTMEAVVAPIVMSLGISRSEAGESKERKELVEGLVKAIYTDLEILANEGRDRQKQMAGYWRYANKHTYNTMVKNN